MIRPFRISFTFLLSLIVLGLLSLESLPIQAATHAWTVAEVPNMRLTDTRLHTSDPDELLDEVSQHRIDSILTEVEAKTTAEIAVVALRSTGETTCKDFATQLFNTWKKGKASKDNGLLILMVEDQARFL
jgi:uncharacterized protein